jgi:hypothetical protein
MVLHRVVDVCISALSQVLPRNMSIADRRQDDRAAFDEIFLPHMRDSVLGWQRLQPSQAEPA